MKFTSINEYISTLPEDTQKAMGEIIAAIEANVPDAEGHISYNMPAVQSERRLFHPFFSVEKSHWNVSYSGWE